MSYRTTTAVALALTASMLGLTACNTGEQEKSVETVTVTKDSATSTENSESASAPNPTSNQESSSQQTSKSSEQANDRTASDTRTDDGYSTSNKKNIARCAKSSEGLYEQGTTWFTDGTTGWTQYCSNIFYDGPATYSEPTQQTTAPTSEYTEPTTQNNQPSPWVQGQIDWNNCLSAGHSKEECRQMLN